MLPIITCRRPASWSPVGHPKQPILSVYPQAWQEKNEPQPPRTTVRASVSVKKNDEYPDTFSYEGSRHGHQEQRPGTLHVPGMRPLLRHVGPPIPPRVPGDGLQNEEHALPRGACQFGDALPIGHAGEQKDPPRLRRLDRLAFPRNSTGTRSGGTGTDTAVRRCRRRHPPRARRPPGRGRGIGCRTR